MAYDDLRRRLERLNRGPLGRLFHRASEMPTAARAHAARESDLSLESLVPGRVRRSGGACFYCVRAPVRDDAQAGERTGIRLLQRMTDPAARTRATRVHEALAGAVASGIEKLLFIDLETCGFAGTPVFLIGTMRYLRSGLFVEQLLARSYGEEPAILSRLGRLLRVRTHLVSFNGKSFDWPFIADRAAICRVDLPDPTGHCDLLHPARRRYRPELPDCRLQTLEQRVCGRRRTGDIPGSDIPAAYHHFVRTGDASYIRTILRHNFLDLVAMADVLAHLLDD